MQISLFTSAKSRLPYPTHLSNAHAHELHFEQVAEVSACKDRVLAIEHHRIKMLPLLLSCYSHTNWEDQHISLTTNCWKFRVGGSCLNSTGMVHSSYQRTITLLKEKEELHVDFSPSVVLYLQMHVINLKTLSAANVEYFLICWVYGRWNDTNWSLVK